MFVTTWWDGCYWHPIGIGILINTLMHRTVPPPPARKNYLVPNVSSAKAENLCCRPALLRSAYESNGNVVKVQLLIQEV